MRAVDIRSEVDRFTESSSFKKEVKLFLDSYYKLQTGVKRIGVDRMVQMLRFVLVWGSSSHTGKMEVGRIVKHFLLSFDVPFVIYALKVPVCTEDKEPKIAGHLIVLQGLYNDEANTPERLAQAGWTVLESHECPDTPSVYDRIRKKDSLYYKK